MIQFNFGNTSFDSRDEEVSGSIVILYLAIQD